MFPLIQCFFFVTSGFFLASPALAEEPEEEPESPHTARHLTVWVGTLFANIDSEMKLNGSALPGDGLGTTKT